MSPTTKRTPINVHAEEHISFGDSAEAVIAAAAQAAPRYLQELEAKRMSLLTELQALDTKINRLKAIVVAGDGTLPPAPTPTTLQYASNTMQEIAKALTDARTCANDVNGVLWTNEAPLRVQAIIDEIKQVTGRTWASSTVYGHLNKLKVAGHASNAGGEWMLTPEGRKALEPSS